MYQRELGIWYSIPSFETYCKDFLELIIVFLLQEWEPSTPGLAVCTRSESEVRKWCEDVAAQRILLTTPSVLVGERLSVYRVEGTTQWYSAFIIGHNQESGEFTVTDDTVLEEHLENPELVQMRILGDGGKYEQN